VRKRGEEEHRDIARKKHNNGVRRDISCLCMFGRRFAKAIKRNGGTGREKILKKRFLLSRGKPFHSGEGGQGENS